jgi:hypothetical protein
VSEKENDKQQLENELKESLEHKLALRREAPLIGLVAFLAALWGSKLFTAISPGSSVVFQMWGYNIHLHHFNYGLIFLAVGLMLTFFEGPWFVRIQHLLFGLGLGFIVDEYWLLLTFDESASVYFGPQSQFISLIIAGAITAAYAAIALGVFFGSIQERKCWAKLYLTIKSENKNAHD